jgi:hypothetical protein
LNQIGDFSFNGALGVVKEIVFKEEESPLDGYLPQYVIVDFPTNCGPVWLESHPSWVPIPAIEIQCHFRDNQQDQNIP